MKTHFNILYYLKRAVFYLRKRLAHFSSVDFYRKRFQVFHKLAPYSWIDDKFFLQFYFFKKLGYRLNLKNPKTFNEKINWLKLYDRKPVYKQLADKLLVRDFISERIGAEYLNELIDVVDSPEDVNWDSLPNSFVIKATHGSGWNIICKDKRSLDIEDSKAKLTKWLASDFYKIYREWQYKGMKPKIIIERYIEAGGDYGLVDYRVFCKHGKPMLIQVELNTYTNHTRGFYTTNWERLPFTYNYPMAEQELPKPINLEQMLMASSLLTKDLHFCRVDFFNEKGILLVSEMTFTPIAGFAMFEPKEYDQILGDLVEIKHGK